MTPPTVLLDGTFITALIDPAHPQHHIVHAEYIAIVEAYRGRTTRPRATSDALAGVDPLVRRTLLAPVETLHVAAQHRKAARAMTGGVIDDEAFALVLVLLHREKIRSVATLDDRFQIFDVTVVPDPVQPPN